MAQRIDICHKIIQKAIPNDPQNLGMGYTTKNGKCLQALVVWGDNTKHCPNCEKEPAVGNPKPRFLNSNEVTLTAKEIAECKAIDDAIAAKIASKSDVIKLETPAVEAKMGEIKKDVINLEVPLKELEAQPDVVRFLLQRVIDGMDVLPVANYGESRKLDKIRTSLLALLEA